MIRSLHLHNTITALFALLKYYRGEGSSPTSTNLQFETMANLARDSNSGYGLLYH